MGSIHGVFQRAAPHTHTAHTTPQHTHALHLSPPTHIGSKQRSRKRKTRLQVTVLDEREVDQCKRDRESICESLAVLKATARHFDCETMGKHEKPKPELSCRQKIKELQDKRNEDICNELKKQVRRDQVFQPRRGCRCRSRGVDPWCTPLETWGGSSAVTDIVGQNVRTSIFNSSRCRSRKRTRSTPLTCARSDISRRKKAKRTVPCCCEAVPATAKDERHDVDQSRLHQESVRAEKLLATAAEGVVRGEAWLTNDAREQFERELLHLSETIPYVGIDSITKAIQVEQNDDWSTLEEDGRVTASVVTCLKTCVRGAVSNVETR